MHFFCSFFAILESFKFPFFARALSHVISSCTWHSLQHVWQFHFRTVSTSKRKETTCKQSLKIQNKSHWNHFKKSILPFSLLLPKEITIFALKYTFKFILAEFWMWDSLALISNTVITPPFHWNWNGCWCFHKRENAFPCWKIKSLLLNFRWWKKSN